MAIDKLSFALFVLMDTKSSIQKRTLILKSPPIGNLQKTSKTDKATLHQNKS